VGDHVRIKFCGITRLADAEAAVSAGAWAIGMIFWDRSPRVCGSAAALEIAAAVKRRAEVAGVFVNPTLDHLTEMADAIGLTLIQLHGQEGPVFCGEAARRTGCKVIKAARVHSGADIQALAAFHTDFHLLDSYVPGVPGGTGETFEWELARSHPSRIKRVLSGGLRPENVGDAIRAVRPYAVDVASGVEVAPGIKDPAAIRRFAEAVAETTSVTAPATASPA
jgi:phosphoribosylanthranilate isomerase